MHPALVQAILNCHRLLLRAYPRRFSAAFADEMQAVFSEALAEAAQRGPGPATRLVLREFWQAPAQALAAHWRDWRAGRRSGLAAGAINAEAEVPFRRPMRVYAAIALLLLAIAIWFAAVTGLGLGYLSTILPVMLVGILILGALAGALAPVLRRLGVRVWLAAGLLCLAGLAWPTSALVERATGTLSPFAGTTLFGLPSAAVVVAAVLLGAGLTVGRSAPSAAGGAGTAAPRPRARRTALACLALSTLLLAKTLHNLYWLLVWDLTYDPLTFLWLIPPVLAALFSGVMLATGLAGKARWAGLYGLLIPALLALVYSAAQRVDFRRLTAERAERMSQALEAYYQREGRYPQDLSELAPWFARSLPGPVIINGQHWCYQAGDDYFRLGYVDRAHWSDPNLLGHVHAARGQMPELPALCAAEIAALREQ